MHMSDALISPVVGGTMCVVSAATIAYCSKKLKEEQKPRLPSLMGVLGAFVFAAQMINFSIAGTGSSGHIGGGILLAALLGPYAAFLTISSVLIVQALFFADGGILALGCNMFNLGFLPCLVVFPLVYKTIMGSTGEVPSRNRIFWGALLASVIGLQLGSFGVVVETRLSGISELPFLPFLAAMQPIHLAIGIVEGLATAALLLFLREMQPALLAPSSEVGAEKKGLFRPALVTLSVLALAVAGYFSWHASGDPDGLEWAVEKTAPQGAMAGEGEAVPSALDKFVEKTALFPDYNLPSMDEESENARYGTSLAGVSGAGITLILALIIGLSRKRKTSPVS